MQYRSRGRRGWSFCLVLAQCWLLWTAPLLAQEADPQRDAALARYQEGREAYRDQDWARAVELFKQAHQLKPNPKLLLYIARAYDKKGDSAGEALRYLELYAASGPRAAEEVGPQLAMVRSNFQRRLVSSARSRVMQARAVASSGESELSVPRLEDPNVGNPIFNDVPYAVRTQPPGAQVYVDDRQWGVQAQTPDTFPLFPGDYTLIIDKPFYESVEVKIRVDGLDRNPNPQFTEVELVRQRVPVVVKARPPSARIIYLSEDGVSRDLGLGDWTGELPAGPARFIVRSSTREQTFNEVLLRSQMDETGHQRLDLDLRKEGQVSASEKITGTLIVKSYLLGGEVYVDGRKIGDTPGSLETSVSPGGHSVSLRKPGYKPWEASLRVDRGELEEVTTPESLELLPDEGINWGGWTFTTLGVAAAGAGGFFTLQGLGQQSDADGLLRPAASDNGPDAVRQREKIAQLEEDADNSHLISYLCYGAAGVSLLTGVLFFALDDGLPEGAQAHTGPRWRMGAVPLQGGAGATLDLSW